MIELNPNLPTRIEGSRAISPTLVTHFLKHAFSPAERKYKVMCLIALTTGLRINEICCLQLSDFVPDTDFTQFLVKVQKKKKENVIVRRVLPEIAAAYVKSWIRDNFAWISSKEGYIFPSTNNKHLAHIRPTNAQTWLSKKRKQLADKYPEIGYDGIYKIINYPNGKKNNYSGEIETKQVLYKFSWHSFRHFYASHISTDPETAMRILRHEDLKTTLRYRQLADIAGTESSLVNELFNEKFYDAINAFNDGIGVTWFKE